MDERKGREWTAAWYSQWNHHKRVVGWLRMEPTKLDKDLSFGDDNPEKICHGAFFSPRR